MTESQWLACNTPRMLLNHVRREISDRKLRLFACACCRRVWHLAGDERLARALEMIERYANGGAERDRLDARKAANAVRRKDTDFSLNCIANELFGAAQKTIQWKQPYPGELASFAVGWATSNGTSFDDLIEGERTAQAGIVKEVLGNPFRLVTFSPSWRTDTALSLARQMYDSRDFGAMPILTDALQDAGCDNEDILNHCRGDEPHVRGCWVVDLVLGKE